MSERLRKCVGLAVFAWAVLNASARGDDTVAVSAHLGFRPLSANPLSPDPLAPTCKAGLWAPVRVEVDPRAAISKATLAEVVIESVDPDDTAVLTRIPFELKPYVPSVVQGYVQPGHVRGDVRVRVESHAGRLAETTARGRPSELRDSLYLVLGGDLPELTESLALKEPRDGSRPTRFALVANDIGDLPDRWLGYDGVDLVILDGGHPEFARDDPRLAPLWEWVRLGGRLIVAVDPARGWFGAPVKSRSVKSLIAVEAWAGLHDKPFPARGEPPAIIAELDLHDIVGTWETLIRHDDPATDRTTPILARTPYGLGSLTVVAFPLSSGPFARWNGRVEFLRTLVDQIGPRHVPPEKTRGDLWGRPAELADWGARLQRDMDSFGLATPSFAAVAGWMLLYALLVSAGDYFFLRRFLRLEATWITLPTLVAGATVIAYASLDLGKDPGVLVNQLTLLDVDANGGVQRATRWYGVRSDRIAAFDLCDGTSPSALIWFGRPDDGPAGMGRAAGLGLARQSYRVDFLRDKPATTLKGVPFPFRGSRTFLAETDVTRSSLMPSLTSDLIYHSRDHPLRVSGSLTNNLPYDLDRAALIVFDRVYPILGGVPRGVSKIEIRASEVGMMPGEWRVSFEADLPGAAPGRFHPGLALWNILFYDRFNPDQRVGNHLFRRLDWSWRLRDDPRVVNVPLSSLGVREAILVGRSRDGSAELFEIDADDAPPVPLAVGPRLASETYVRAVLPLRPQP